MSKKIAKRHDRSAIESLFLHDSKKLYFHTPENLEVEGVYDLAAYVVAEIADPNEKHGLKIYLKQSYGFYWHESLIVGMDYFHDEASRSWLLAAAFSDKRASRYALQLLRGYESTKNVRNKLEVALGNEVPKLRKETSVKQKRIHESRISDIRAVLASFDHATGLKDAESRSSYRDFQSRLWRARAIGRKGYGGRDMEYNEVVTMMTKQWRDGDEEFVLQIFEESASTSDEARIAVYLVSPDLKRTYNARLQAVAKSTSPQAPYARMALARIESQDTGR